MTLVERIRYAGRRVECPVCDRRFRAFAPEQWDGRAWRGAPLRCPACGSRPRHRLLAYVLREERLATPATDVLHVAPEPLLGDRLRTTARHYVSADLEPGAADVAADLTRLPFESESFDLLICSHVLEHVDDDLAAMREMQRVLRHGAVALIQTPVNYDQSETFEDPAVTDPAERLALFSQPDHVRVYGPDLRDRLESAGFDVSVRDAAELGPLIGRFGLEPRRGPLRNDLYRCVAI